MPMPPSQVLNWRQNSIERLRPSTSVSHRRAGRGEARHRLEVGVERFESCGSPVSRNGSAPNTGTSSQIRATTRKLSRGPTAAPVFGR